MPYLKTDFIGGDVNKVVRIPQRVVDGFLFLFRGVRGVVRVRGAWWLLLAPIILNLLIFSGFLSVFFMWVVPMIFAFMDGALFGSFLSSVISVLLFVFVIIVYALGFSILAELLGAPFYEEIGVRVDQAADFSVNERPWWKDIFIVFKQEVSKMLILGIIGFFLVLLQFAPGTGQVISVVFGFLMTIIVMGADSVAPALYRRGFGYLDRRKWVLIHIWPVIGIGMAKMFGLFIPGLNIVVLPMAAAGGTMLVQKYNRG